MHTGAGYVLEALTASTLQLRSTAAGFLDFGFVHPTACNGNTSSVAQAHRFSFNNGDTLSAGLCNEGSISIVTVTNPGAFTNTFHCQRTHSNAVACQRLF